MKLILDEKLRSFQKPSWLSAKRILLQKQVYCLKRRIWLGMIQWCDGPQIVPCVSIYLETKTRVLYRKSRECKTFLEKSLTHFWKSLISLPQFFLWCTRSLLSFSWFYSSRVGGLCHVYKIEHVHSHLPNGRFYFFYFALYEIFITEWTWAIKRCFFSRRNNSSCSDYGECGMKRSTSKISSGRTRTRSWMMWIIWLYGSGII